MTSPLEDFKTELTDFAQGKQGIRNPFVIVPMVPAVEDRVKRRLTAWEPDIDGGGSIQHIDLEEQMSQTHVFELICDLGDAIDAQQTEQTMQRNLGTELGQQIASQIEDPSRQSHIVLLLGLGSLYPFSRASELLDELDRLGVRSTIGIPFPGDIIGGKLNYFGEESSNYYPAHRIDERITEEHLQ